MEIVEIRLVGGNEHQHIVRVRWRVVGSSNAFDAEATVAEVIRQLKIPIPVYAIGRNGAARARVFIASTGTEYIESDTDATSDNDLLGLARL